MRARGVIQSPVLVGRDAYLALIETRLAAGGGGRWPAAVRRGREQASARPGCSARVARHAQAGGFAVARGAAFPGDAQSLAGLLLDLASDLASAAGQ